MKTVLIDNVPTLLLGPTDYDPSVPLATITREQEEYELQLGRNSMSDQLMYINRGLYVTGQLVDALYRAEHQIGDHKMLQLNMTKADANNAADLIELYFFQNLRDDDGIDNMDYVRSLLRAYDALREAAQ